MCGVQCAPSRAWRKPLEMKTTLKQPNKYARHFWLCRRQYFFTDRLTFFSTEIFLIESVVFHFRKRIKKNTRRLMNAIRQEKKRRGRTLASFRTHFLSSTVYVQQQNRFYTNTITSWSERETSRKKNKGKALISNIQFAFVFVVWFLLRKLMA